MPLIEICNTRGVTFGEGEMIGSDLEIGSAKGKWIKGENTDSSFSPTCFESWWLVQRLSQEGTKANVHWSAFWKILFHGFCPLL